MLPQYESLLVELNSNIAHVMLNRPDKSNAMNLTMWDELRACFEWADQTPEVRVVILSGEGKNFCAGMDLSVFASQDQGKHIDDGRKSENLRLGIKKFQQDLSTIERCRKPVLAAIHGAAIGGAIDMTTCCDMRYSTEDARFSIKEIDLGFAADAGTLQRLPKLIGDGIVRELAYTGRIFNGLEARSYGLVNLTFSNKEAMMIEVMKIAATIAKKSPLAIRGTKEMILYTREHSVEDGLNYVATWNAAMLRSADVKIAIKAQMKGIEPEFDN